MPRASYKEFRCVNCRKLLFKAVLVDSVVEVKCKRCATLNSFEGIPANELVCLVENCPNRVSVSHKK